MHYTLVFEVPVQDWNNLDEYCETERIGEHLCSTTGWENIQVFTFQKTYINLKKIQVYKLLQINLEKISLKLTFDKNG